jgi:hypothetical protein
VLHLNTVFCENRLRARREIQSQELKDSSDIAASKYQGSNRPRCTCVLANRFRKGCDR